MKAKGYIVTLLGSHTPIVKRPISPPHYAPFAAPLRPFRRLTTPPWRTLQKINRFYTCSAPSFSSISLKKGKNAPISFFYSNFA